MCYEFDAMFLAKSWKTVNGKRYPKWDLKKSVWDKDEKRQKQEYVAYIGTSQTISFEKACEICSAKGLTMDALRSVNRLKIEEPSKPKRRDLSINVPLHVFPTQREEPVSEDQESDVEFDTPEATPAEMVRDLREYFGFDATYEDYDDLAYRIDPSIEAEDLRMVEEDRAVLEGRPQERLRSKWRWATGRDVL